METAKWEKSRDNKREGGTAARALRKFFIPPEAIKGNIATLEKADCHHLRQVLRARVGTLVVLRTVGRRSFLARLERFAGQQAFLRLEKEFTEGLERKRKERLELFLAVPRPTVLTAITQKSSELDIACLTPVLTERSFFRDKKRVNQERLERIAREALKQTGGREPTEIHPPLKLTELEKKLEQKRPVGEFRVLAWEGAEVGLVPQLKKQLEALTTSHRTLVEADDFILRWRLFIGSEGGITHGEKAYLEQLGFEAVSLGQLILRVETAVVYCTAALRTLAEGALHEKRG